MSSTLQQEQVKLQDRLQCSERKAGQAQEGVQQSQTELQALSQAYADLEAHAFSLESKLGELQRADASRRTTGEISRLRLEFEPDG